jgi:hypothetical protein
VQFVEPGVGWSQVPIVPPDGIVQMPPQHSASCEHEFPLTMHHDALPHVPLELQNAPQQSPFAVHGLPALLQFVLSGAQAPLLHWPPQHWPFEVHEPLSGVQLLWHTPLTQLNEQQSVFELHVVPAAEQFVGLTVQPPCGSHMFEQQSAPVAHCCPYSPQTTFASGPLPFFLLWPQATRHPTANTKTIERDVIKVSSPGECSRASISGPDVARSRKMYGSGRSRRVPFRTLDAAAAYLEDGGTGR